MPYKLKILDSMWDVVIDVGSGELFVLSEIMLSFLKQLQAWRSVVPVAEFRVIPMGVPVDRVWKFQFTTTDDRQYEVDLEVPVEGGGRLRPISDEFWTNAEIRSYHPVVAKVFELLQRYAVTKINVAWK